MDSVGGGSRRVLLRGRQPVRKGPIVFGVRAGLQTQGLNPSTGADLGIANADKDFGYQLGFLAGSICRFCTFSRS